MRDVKPTFVLLVLGALLLWPSLAQAYQIYRMGPYMMRWQSNTINFVVNTEGMADGSEQAIQEAMDTWSNAGANLAMVKQGASSSHDYGKSDGQNLIDRGELDSDSTIAETMWWYQPRTGLITDTDVRLNQNLPWATTGDANSYDVQSLVTHELGHTLVLGDLYGQSDQEKTMYGYADKGETNKRTLATDDISGIKMLYE
jgi:hypothetical protein